MPPLALLHGCPKKENSPASLMGLCVSVLARDFVSAQGCQEIAPGEEKKIGCVYLFGLPGVLVAPRMRTLHARGAAPSILWLVAVVVDPDMTLALSPSCATGPVI